MDTARWMRVRSIVERAVELQGAERDAFVAGECGGDAELQHEIASLLALDANSASLRLPDPLEVARAIGDANLGRRIGPYVIERLLGAGGMGVVYLARRVDSDFEQYVALKLIKRGMDTDDILRQFRKERAVLAALQHPCIARLYDGGATDDGRPWIAMEHVGGVPIDVWCAERRLSVRARVELFVEVCSAVQHAHQALIVHRDLKPSNILVTSEGTPKLLDFGVAKVLTPEGAEASEPTIASARHLTPAYASPQQLHGEAATTATDVYSLGVVLYELLAGYHPFRGESGERAEPARPSTRATRLDEPRAASAGDLRRIRRQIRGDLDTIVLTALAPEVVRRYASVEALAGDLRRYLEGLPIQARPATWAYQTSKFVRRHAVAVAAGAAVVTALVVGLLFARAGYVEAVAQRKLAEQRESTAKTESARSDAMVALTQRMLRAASPHDVKDRDYTVRQLLDEFDRSVGGNWGVEPQVEATMREIMGRVYRELGILDKAQTHLVRALELDRAALGEDDERTIECRMSWITLLHDRGEYAAAEAECSNMIARLEPRADRRGYFAAVLTERGDQLQHLNRLEESESDLRRALAIRREPGFADRRLIGETLVALSSTLQIKRDFAGAEQALDEALEIMRREYGDRSLEVASALNNLGALLQLGGHLDRAEVLLRESLDIEREVLGANHVGAGMTLNNLGRLLLTRGDIAGAEPLLREALALARSGHGANHPNVATDLSALGLLLQQRGDYAEAEPLFRECLQIRLAAYGELHVDTTRAMNNLALLLQKRGQLEEAETLLRRALATRRKMQGERHLTIAAPLINLSGVLLAKNDLAAAEQAAREAVSIFRENVGPAHTDLASALDILGGVRISQGANEEAEALIREGLEMRIGLFGREHPDVARSIAHLGDVLASKGDLAEAESQFAEAEAMQRRLIGARNPALARTLHNRANVAELGGRPADAEAGFREALSIRRSALGDAHADTRETARRLIALLEARGESEGAAALRRELGLDVAGATAEH